MQKTSHETIAAIVEALESSGAKAVVTSEDPLALFFNTSPDEPVNVIADSDDSEPRVLWAPARLERAEPGANPADSEITRKGRRPWRSEPVG